MKIIMQDGLPTISITLGYQGSKMFLEDILLDTGCATTIFDIDEGKRQIIPTYKCDSTFEIIVKRQ